MKHIYSIWLALLGLAFFVSCSQQNNDELDTVLLQGKTMGTSYQVKFVAKKSIIEQHNFYREVEKVLKDVNDKMSTYQKDSELSRFNQYQGTDGFTVSADTASVVKAALALGKLTEGALDVTVGPLVNLWGFGPNARPENIPSAEKLSEIRNTIGLDKLRVSDSQLFKSNANLYVDLSAIAKGFGVDKIAALLEQKGVDAYMVEIGGEMRLKGKKQEGSDWLIAIEKPVSIERAVQQVIAPGDNALATSGDYRNYYERDGIRYSHTIDPITGKPISHKLVSVSVIADTCMQADALATALNVMGPEKALSFAQQQRLAVYLVIKSESGFDVQYTEYFERYMR
ncbi:FAD:protein FMN transferase [Catenovulum sediminis]|uniref:FAD:protein FMN transferase n=1 Tax=Catenovulum sediminis TaxID=1740262 RepID=UPI001180CBC9|nr:FAD:protein FMN transferase [Catenovulum sediminis]